MLSAGFFVDIDRLEDFSGGLKGINWGGGFYLLGVQTLAVVCIIAWSVVVSFLLLMVRTCVTSPTPSAPAVLVISKTLCMQRVILLCDLFFKLFFYMHLIFISAGSRCN